jgi:hypothetical protein
MIQSVCTRWNTRRFTSSWHLVLLSWQQWMYSSSSRASVKSWRLNPCWYQWGCSGSVFKRQVESEEKLVQEMATWHEQVCSREWTDRTRNRDVWLPQLPAQRQRTVTKSTAVSTTKKRKKYCNEGCCKCRKRKTFRHVMIFGCRK